MVLLTSFCFGYLAICSRYGAFSTKYAQPVCSPGSSVLGRRKFFKRKFASMAIIIRYRYLEYGLVKMVHEQIEKLTAREERVTPNPEED